MIKIAICDDDIKLTSLLEKHIFEYEETEKNDVEVFFSGEELLNSYNKGESFDLLYLDVELGGINGIDVAHEIRKIDKHVLIIYITAYVNFAPSAFEVNAFRFLSKPIDEERFDKYYKLAISEIIKTPKYFRYSFKRENFKVLISDIMYFESQKRMTYLKTKNQSEEKCYLKLNAVEIYLIENHILFYRISQSLLVNPDFVYSYKFNKMVLKNNEELTIASNRRKKVTELFCKIKGDLTID